MLDIVYVGIERVHKNAALSQDSRVNREDKCLTIITIFHQVWSSASSLGSQGLFTSVLGTLMELLRLKTGQQ